MAITRITNSAIDSVNNSKVYLAVGILGSVISLLYYYVEGSESKMITAFFFTLLALVLISLSSERSYYRRHNAILASSQFVILPFLPVFYAEIWSYQSYFPTYFSFTFSSFFTSTLYFTFNGISLLAVPFAIYQSVLFDNLNSRRWLGFAVRRKLFKSRTVPFFLQSTLAVLVLLTTFERSVMDIAAGIIPVFWIYSIFKYYLQKKVSHTYLSPSRSGSTPTFGTSSHSSSIPQGRSTRTNRRSEIPVSSRKGSRKISTTYRRQRTISPTGSKTERNATISRQDKKGTNTVANSRKTSSTIQVDDGIEIVTMDRNSKRVRNVDSHLLPSISVSKDDLACVICYDEFKVGDGDIILCPHCKYPAHESEYMAWMQTSSLCPRCSKKVSHASVKSPKYRIDAKNYVSKVLKKL